MAHTPVVATLKCPNCGAALKIGASVTDFACAYCGAQQIVEREGGIISLRLISESVSRIQVSTDKTASELALQRLEGELFTLQQQQQKLTAERTAKERDIRSQRSLLITVFVAGLGWLVIAALADWTTEGKYAAAVFAVILAACWRAHTSSKVKRGLAKSHEQYQPQLNPLNSRIASIQQQIERHRAIVDGRPPMQSHAVPHTSQMAAVASGNTDQKRGIGCMGATVIVVGLFLSFLYPPIPITLGSVLILLTIACYIPKISRLPRALLFLKLGHPAGNFCKISICVLVGTLFLIGGIGVAQEQAKDSQRAKAKEASEEQQQQLTKQANQKSESLLREADAACQAGNLTLAMAKLDEAQHVPYTNNWTMLPPVRTKIATVRVDGIMKDVAQALQAGDIPAAQAKVDAALAIRDASNMDDVKKFNAMIKNATDVPFLTDTMADLPDDVIAQIKSGGELPTTLISGYAVLDQKTSELVRQHIADITAARERIKQEKLAAAEKARQEAEERKAQEQAAARAKAEAEQHRDESRLVGDKYVFVAATKDDLNRLNKLCNAKDAEGISLMVLRGSVMAVPSGTRCRIISHGIMTCEVRILEGDYYPRSGFVASELVR